MGIRRTNQQQGKTIWPPLGNNNLKATKYEEFGHNGGLFNNNPIDGGKKKPQEQGPETNNKKGGKFFLVSR